jgi:hypothetical protein
MDRRSGFRRVAGRAIFVLAAVALQASAVEAAAIKVYSPKIEQGETEIEYQGYRTFDSDSTKDHEQVHKVGLGYGITDWWAVEVKGSWKRDPGGSTDFDATEFETRFEFVEEGEAFVSLGLLVEYELADDRHAGADELEFGPLVSKEIGNTTATANIIFERQVGANRAGGVGFTYRLQERWRFHPHFEPGIEAFGNLGPIDNFNSPNRQEHMIGPVAHGKIGELSYDVGYLFGATGATADGTLKAILEYEIEF